MARGRPPTDRKADRKITVYLAPHAIAALDRLADRRTIQGENTSRSDLVREAVQLLLEREM